LIRNERKCCLALKIAARLTAGLGRIEIVRLSADPVEACARSDSHPRFCEGGPRELQKRCGRHSELVAVCAAKTGPDLAQSPGTFTNVVHCASAYPVTDAGELAALKAEMRWAVNGREIKIEAPLSAPSPMWPAPTRVRAIR
jgi:hypothetical protein